MGSKKRRGLRLVDDEFSGARRKFRHDLALIGMFRKFPQPRRLFAPDTRVRTVFRIDDAGKYDRQSSRTKELQKRDGSRYGFPDIAATQYVWIGEAINEIDDQQGWQTAEACPLTKLLPSIDVVVVQWTSLLVIGRPLLKLSF